MDIEKGPIDVDKSEVERIDFIGASAEDYAKELEKHAGKKAYIETLSGEKLYPGDSLDTIREKLEKGAKGE